MCDSGKATTPEGPVTPGSDPSWWKDYDLDRFNEVYGGKTRQREPTAEEAKLHEDLTNAVIPFKKQTFSQFRASPDYDKAKQKIWFLSLLLALS